MKKANRFVRIFLAAGWMVTQVLIFAQRAPAVAAAAGGQGAAVPYTDYLAADGQYGGGALYEETASDDLVYQAETYSGNLEGDGQAADLQPGQSITFTLDDNAGFESADNYLLEVVSCGDRTQYGVQVNGEDAGSIFRVGTAFNMEDMTPDWDTDGISLEAGDTITLTAPNDGSHGWVDKIVLYPRSILYQGGTYYAQTDETDSAADLQPGDTIPIWLADQPAFTDGWYTVKIVSCGNRTQYDGAVVYDMAAYDVDANPSKVLSIYRAETNCNMSGMTVDGTDQLIELHQGNILAVSAPADGTYGWVDSVILTLHPEKAVEPLAQTIADSITGVDTPVQDATELTLPAVPEGYTIALKSSSVPGVVALDGTITPLSADTPVSLVFTVTRTSDNTTADTGALSVTVPAKSQTNPPSEPSAQDIADSIISVNAPARDAERLMFPAVPDGYAIVLKSSSVPGVVALDGTITAPSADTPVSLVFTVTRISDNTTADTGALSVTVPAKSQTMPSVPSAQEIANLLTSVATPAQGATDLTFPVLPVGYAIALAYSSDRNVVALDGTITPPDDAATVKLAFTVTRTWDNTTAETGELSVTVPAKRSSAQKIANAVTGVAAPAQDAKALTFPAVPDGYSIMLKSSSASKVVALNGTITPPSAAATVKLVFTITRTSDNTTADTGVLSVTIPAKSVVYAPSVSYAGHVQKIGWQKPVSNGAEAGTDGRALRMEAVQIQLGGTLPQGAGIRYEAHVQHYGWMNPVANKQVAGTTGRALRMEALRVTLQNMPGYAVQYRAHVQSVGWLPWQTTKNGTDVSRAAIAGTTGRALRMEAVEIRIVKIS